MFKYFLRYKWQCFILVICIIAAPTLNSFLNLWLEKIFDETHVGSPLAFVFLLLITGCLLWIGKRVLLLLADTIKKNYLANIRYDIKNDTFLNLINVNTSELSNIASGGEYTSVFLNDINILEERYFSTIIDFITSLVAIIINGAAFIYLNVKIAIPIAAFGIFVMFIPSIFYNRVASSNFEYSSKIARFTQKLNEFIFAYPTIKNYAVEKVIIKKFSEGNIDTERSKFKAEQDLIIANSVGSMLSWFMQIISIGIGLVLYTKGEILFGTIVASRSFASDIASPLQGLVADFNSILSIKKIEKKIDEMTKFNNDSQIEANKVDNENCTLNYKDVSYSVGEKNILNDFNYEFKKGKKYLIIGENGAGKSTLFRILKKKTDNYTGLITLGGVDVNKLSTSEIGRHVTYMNENVSIFTGTVKENVTLFQNNHKEEEINSVFELAQVRLSKDYEIKDNGFNISSGEKRRIEIARSLLQNTDILIFDEVVSTLDALTAYEIENMVLNFDKTVIFISHNFSRKLIEHYDQIIVLEEGKITATGKFNELIKTSEFFKKLCEVKFGI